MKEIISYVREFGVISHNTETVFLVVSDKVPGIEVQLI